MRILYLGMGGEYSLIPLRRLVDAGTQVAAVVFPRPSADDLGPRWLPAAALHSGNPDLVVMPQRENILTVAGEHGIPALEVGSMRNEKTLKIIEEMEADLVVAACFPQILPEIFLSIPRLGCLNIHPSLLPAYRGPQPLFWQFRVGEKNMGVSVHWMDTGVDTGDMLGQTKVQFPAGITAVAADKLAAQAGAEIVLGALETDDFPRHPQGSKAASYQGRPNEEDMVISAGWGVQRAFNFVLGADVWAPFWIEMEGEARVELQQALGYQLGMRLLSSVEERDGERWVQMRDGALKVR